MYDRSLTSEPILSLLAATPSRFADLSEGLGQAQLVTLPEPGEWSVRDVLAHLRACADLWGNCIMAILAEDTPTDTGAGTPLVRTVHPYAQWMARHERPRIKQIERIANTMRTE